MKTEIHPEYDAVTIHCSCGNEIHTRSTSDDMRVELCSECHPFYTGKQKLVDTGGRIERFERRFGRRKNSKVQSDEVGAVEGPPAGAAEADVELGEIPQAEADALAAERAEEAAAAETASDDAETTEEA